MRMVLRAGSASSGSEEVEDGLLAVVDDVLAVVTVGGQTSEGSGAISDEVAIVVCRLSSMQSARCGEN